MQFIYFLILILLILVIIAGFLGLFFYKQNIRKICCLSISYSSFLLYFIIISFQNSAQLNAILAVMVSVLIVFLANLLVGAKIAQNLKKQN